MYRVCFAFPIDKVVQALWAKLPPWIDNTEMKVIKAVISYWLHNDLYILLPEGASYELVEQWMDLANDYKIAEKLYDIVNGPTHPAWNPAFDSIPDKIVITKKSLLIAYTISDIKPND